MGIEQIEVYKVSLRYSEPFKIAAGTSTEANNIVIRVLTDYDAVGLGESSPSKRVTGETAKTVLRAIDRIAPKLLGKCPLRIENDVETMDSTVPENPAAKAAIDIALHDILGQTARKPLYRLIGGYRTEVLTDITLGIKPPKQTAQDALSAVKNGFKALKVKVGIDPLEDVECVRLIREAVDGETQLRIDANQGWKPEQAIEVLNKMDAYDVQFAEQPVRAEDIEGLGKVRRDSPIPIMADESVHSPEDALRLVRAEAVDLMNIKLMKCGGILKARKIAAVAEAAGIPCMIGCMGESGLGISAATHLAAAVKNIKYADLDSDLLLRDKLVKKGGTEIKNSVRTFPKASGLGIKDLDHQLLGEPIRVFR